MRTCLRRKTFLFPCSLFRHSHEYKLQPLSSCRRKARTQQPHEAFLGPFCWILGRRLLTSPRSHMSPGVLIMASIKVPWMLIASRGSAGKNPPRRRKTSRSRGTSTAGAERRDKKAAASAKTPFPKQGSQKGLLAKDHRIWPFFGVEGVY